MRSLIIAPADDEAALAAALASEADAVAIDLFVAQDRRGAARARAARILKEFGAQSGAPALIVRVSPLADGEADRDLDAVMAAGPCAVLLPKARGAASVQQLSVKLALREASCGLDDGATGIIAAVDAAEALLGMASFRSASARLIGLAWDAEALRADIGAETCRDDAGRYSGAYALARDLTLIAAAAAGVAAIDTVFAGVRDAESLRAEASAARRDGFAAKVAIDGNGARIINEIFGARRKGGG
jgi:citrate lyase subunit beta / citryl-CoA lyase